jgi:hypothetical protein
VVAARLNFIIGLNPSRDHPPSHSYGGTSRYQLPTPQANPEFKRANDFFNNFEKIVLTRFRRFNYNRYSTSKSV